MTQRRVLMIFDKYCAGNDRLDIGIGDYVFIQSLQHFEDIHQEPFYLYQKDVADPAALYDRLRTAIAQFKPDLIVMTPHFVGKGVACVPERKMFREITRGIPTVLISYDTGNDAIIRVPTETGNAVSWISYWDGYADVIMHTDCYYYVQEQFMGDRSLSQHVCGYTPFDPALGHQDEPLERDIDYAFMGSVYQYRQPFIKALQDSPYNGFIGDGPTTGRQLDYDEYLTVLKRSKLAINFSKSWRGDSEQIKVRIWEVLTCGAVLVEQDSPESRRVLEPYDCAVFFSTPEDLAQQITHYLQHPEQIAEKLAASQRFLQDYDYRRFWTLLFDTVDSLPLTRSPLILPDSLPLDDLQQWVTDAQSLSVPTLMAAADAIAQHNPSKIITMGRPDGMVARVGLSVAPDSDVVAIAHSLEPLKTADVPGADRLTLCEQDPLITDFNPLWDESDRVVFHLNVCDCPGRPLTPYVLEQGLSSLPSDSLLLVSPLWFSPTPLTQDTIGAFWNSRVSVDVDEWDCFEGVAVPYWKGGSVFGGEGVRSLMAWVNHHQLELDQRSGLNLAAIAIPGQLSYPQHLETPTAQLNHNPVGNFSLRPQDQQHPALKSALNLCQVGSQLFAIAQYEAASHQFQSAASQLPYIGGVFYAQALCALNRGDRIGAKQSLQQEIQFQPVHPNAHRLLKQL